MNSIETDRLNLNMHRVRLPACRDASSPRRGIRKNISIIGHDFSALQRSKTLPATKRALMMKVGPLMGDGMVFLW